MKKTISVFLIMLCIVISPVTVYAATGTYRISTAKEITVIKGDVVKLTLSSKYKNITWSSSNKNIATISTKGTLTAKAEGKITVTAKSGKKSFKSVVFVYEDYSDWIVVDTNMYDLVRDGMLSGAIVYYEEDYYFVSPDYYTNVLEPKIDALEENIVYENDISGDEYTPNTHILTPDTEFIIKDDAGDDEADANALKKRLQEMIESEKATSE